MNHASTRAADRPIKVIRPTQSAIEILCTGFMSLLSRKSLFVEMALLRLRVRYKQSLLGWAWAILPPLVLMITYTVVFYKVAGFTTGDLPVALFIFAGLIPWTFLSTSISTATAGIVANRYLIVRASFPREIIPLSYVATAFVDLGIGSVMLIAMMYCFGFAPNLHILYAIPVIGMLGMYGAAVSLCFSSFQARFRDIGVAMPLLLQVAMFATPVVYSSAAIPQSVAHIYFLNPLAILVEQFRQAVVQGINPNVGDMLYCAIIAVVCLVFSYILFKRLDATLADVI
jgi:homopolymeric O-antigen transport system permease protein